MPGAPISSTRIITDYDDLIRAIRDRRNAMGVPQIKFDDMTGLTDGYLGKLKAALNRPEAPNTRFLGSTSLSLVLGALGVELVMVPKGSTRARDPASTRRKRKARRRGPYPQPQPRAPARDRPSGGRGTVAQNALRFPLISPTGVREAAYQLSY